MDALIFVLFQIGCATALALTALAAGLPAVRRLGCTSVAERVVWGFVLGLLAIAQTFLGLALARLFVPWTVGLLAVGAVVWGGSEVLALLADFRSMVRRLAPVRRRWTYLGCVAGVAPWAAGALYPPFEWDETIYHLVWARSLVAQHALVVQPQLRAPAFPPLAELLQAGMLILGGDVAAHWVSFWATAATAGLLASWPGFANFGRQRWLSAALYLGTPLVVFLSGLGYVDPLLVLWVTAALAAVARSRANDDRRWLIVAGACVGGAAGVKYLALFFVGWLCFEVFWTARRGWLRRLGDSLRIAVPAGLIAAPVYAWIFAATGNPLFPFYAGIFGSTPWSYEPVSPAPSIAQHALAALNLPWKALVARADVGGMPPYSPFWLAALVLAVAGVLVQRQWRWTVVMSAAYLWVIPVNSRYLLPVLPVLGLAGVMTLAQARPSWWRSPQLAALAVGLVFVPGWAYAARLCALRGPLPTTRAERNEFLGERLPCYAAVRWLNEHQGDHYVAYGMALERLAGLAAGRWYGDHSGPWSFDRVEGALARHRTAGEALSGTGAGWVVAPKAWQETFLSSDRAHPPSVTFDDGACAVLELRPPASPGASEADGLIGRPAGQEPSLRTAPQ